MLLIVGGESDPNTQRVVDQAHIRDLAYYFLNTDEPDAHQIAWDYQKPELTLSETTVRPSAIVLRYNVFAGDPSGNLAAFDVVQSFALAWPEVKFLNRRTTTDLNNKSKNLRLAIDVGFESPETLVKGNQTPLAISAYCSNE